MLDQRGGDRTERDHSARAPRRRRDVSDDVRAVVGVSHGNVGAGAAARRTIRSRSPSKRRTRAGSNCTRGSIRSARCCRSSPARRRRRTSRAQHPEWIRKYGTQTWIDPGDPAARKYVLETMLDVVKRYDVDGIHIDDYFYPYRESRDGHAPREEASASASTSRHSVPRRPDVEEVRQGRRLHRSRRVAARQHRRLRASRSTTA